jgi:hypothetical protein
MAMVLSSSSYLFAQEDSSSSSRTFGVVEAYWRPETAAELGVSWELITFDWRRIQPDGPSQFELEATRQEWIEEAQAAGREIVGLIINTPVWASQSGAASAVPDGLYESDDSPENLWGVFLRQLMQETADFGIKRWIIWDNPDIPVESSAHTFEGSVLDYYRLIKVAYLSITSIDPEAEIYTGGLHWWYDVLAERELYLQSFINTALDDPSAPANGYFFDGVSLNLILPPEPAGGLVITSDSAGDVSSTARRILDEAGMADKAVWITRLNAVPTINDYDPLPDATSQITLTQQADFIVQATALALGADVERIAVHKLFDSNYQPGATLPYGLLRPDNSRRPAFDAYAFAIQAFSPPSTITVGRSSNSRLVVFEQAEQTVYVMWSSATVGVDFWIQREFGDVIQVFDANGNPLPEPRPSVGVADIDVHVIETEPASADEAGVVRVSGSPIILIMQGAPRPVWAAVDASAVRIFN